jgi:hypothetical protein
MAPGIVVVRARLHGDDRVLATKTLVIVRSGWLTSLDLMPDPRGGA